MEWWLNAIKKYKKSLNSLKNSKDPNDYIVLKKPETTYVTKSNKTLSWTDFASSINDIIDP